MSTEPERWLSREEAADLVPDVAAAIADIDRATARDLLEQGLPLPVARGADKLLPLRTPEPRGDGPIFTGAVVTVVLALLATLMQAVAPERSAVMDLSGLPAFGALLAAAGTGILAVRMRARRRALQHQRTRAKALIILARKVGAVDLREKIRGLRRQALAAGLPEPALDDLLGALGTLEDDLAQAEAAPASVTRVLDDLEKGLKGSAQTGAAERTYEVVQRLRRIEAALSR